MATPAETRDQLISQLRATRNKLTSPAWLMMIEAAPEKKQDKAAKDLLKVQLALLKLEREALTSFREQLVANEAALAQSTQKLQAALDRLQSVAKVLSALTSFLRVIARVVALV